MSDRIQTARDAHYGSLLLGRYPIQTLTEDAYWETFERELRPTYPPEVFFSLQRDRVEPAVPANGLKDHWYARDHDAVVAMFCGDSHDRGRYQMRHTVVSPAYQRRGIYSEIIARALAYSADLGYSVVISEHSPANSAVLIAKLKAGFCITGLELDAAFGTSVVLTHFHDPAELAAYRYRCGDATLTPELIAEGFGAMDGLRTQFRAADGLTGDR